MLWEINRISFKNVSVYNEALKGSWGKGWWTYKKNIDFGQNFQTQIIANSGSSIGLSELDLLNNKLLQLAGESQVFVD